MSGFESFAAASGLRLEPFQKRISKAIAGPERECVALVPRGQGKTALLALLTRPTNHVRQAFRKRWDRITSLPTI